MGKGSVNIYATSHDPFYGDHNNSIRQSQSPPRETNARPLIYHIPAEAPIQTAHYSSHDMANESPNQPSISATTSHQSAQLQGVVMIGPGRFPRKSKYAGMSSGQVLAKSAEELFKEQAPQVDVMKFFCPLMSFAEEHSAPKIISKPLVGKAIADRAVRSKDFSGVESEKKLLTTVQNTFPRSIYCSLSWMQTLSVRHTKSFTALEIVKMYRWWSVSSW